MNIKHISEQQAIIIAQEKKDTEKSDEETSETFNKWTIEATVGQAKGVKPYSKGYFSSDARTFLGKPQANAFSLGTRFMFSPIFGIKGAFHYETLKNIEGSGSLPFEMQRPICRQVLSAAGIRRHLLCKKPSNTSGLRLQPSHKCTRGIWSRCRF
jgi:hypothetical protein